MLFFTDLDNTIIFSHRHVIDTPLVWVESLNNKNQSFMTKKTYDYFLYQDWLHVVPITARTPTQYQRLMETLKKLKWNEALICNGAIRMINGKEDLEWTRESNAILEESKDSLKDAYEISVKKYGTSSIALVKWFMFYIKTDDVKSAYSFLLKNIDLEHLIVYKDSRKVYCIPSELNKGNAVKRYKENIVSDICIVAGDSEFDIPMLIEANISLCPDKLNNFSKEGLKYVCSGFFSDEICKKLEKIRGNQIL